MELLDARLLLFGAYERRKGNLRSPTSHSYRWVSSNNNVGYLVRLVKIHYISVSLKQLRGERFTAYTSAHQSSCPMSLYKGSPQAYEIRVTLLCEPTILLNTVNVILHHITSQ